MERDVSDDFLIGLFWSYHYRCVDFTLSLKLLSCCQFEFSILDLHHEFNLAFNDSNFVSFLYPKVSYNIFYYFPVFTLKSEHGLLSYFSGYYSPNIVKGKDLC